MKKIEEIKKMNWLIMLKMMFYELLSVMLDMVKQRKKSLDFQ